MPTHWHDELTAVQSERLESACEMAYAHFGSYQRAAQAVTEVTGHSVSHETMRRYLQTRNVPVHIAATLSQLTQIPLFDFVPWLPTYCGGIRK